jgi:hypothetical protein
MCDAWELSVKDITSRHAEDHEGVSGSDRLFLLSNSLVVLRDPECRLGFLLLWATARNMYDSVFWGPLSLHLPERRHAIRLIRRDSGCRDGSSAC